MTANPAAPFAVGEVICGRFLIEEFLGRGGTGCAYRVTDAKTEIVAVCKISLPRVANARQAILEQYRRLLQVSSPHLARTLGYFEHEDAGDVLGVLVLELVRGTPAGAWAEGRALRDRLAVVARVAEAVAGLHRAAIVHGDIFDENVIITDDGRAVLIDPDAGSLGPSRQTKRAPPSSGSIDRDLRALGDLISTIIPEPRPSPVGEIVSSLANKDPPKAELVASELRAALLRDRLPGESATLSALGVRFRDSIQENKEQYVTNRQARSLAIEILAARIRADGKPFDVDVSYEAQGVDSERLSDQAKRGLLLEQKITCETPDGVPWAIHAEAYRDFVKPWPRGNDPGCVGTLKSVIQFGDGAPIVYEDLQLRLHEGVARLYSAPPNSEPRLLDENAWIDRSLRLLVADRFAGVITPHRMEGGPKVPMSAWPSDFAFEPNASGKLSFVWEGGDVATATGLPWLYTEIFKFLVQSRLSMFWDAPTKIDKREIVQALAGIDFPGEFAKYVDVTYGLEVWAHDHDQRGLCVEIDFKPYGGSRLTWLYTITPPDPPVRWQDRGNHDLVLALALDEPAAWAQLPISETTDRLTERARYFLRLVGLREPPDLARRLTDLARARLRR